MKRGLIAVLVTLILSTVCSIGDLNAVEMEGDLELLGGYRTDDLNWSIAGNINGTNPNILSELAWSDLESYQLKVAGKGTINRVLYLRGSANFGWVLNGQVQDSDYAGDNRTLEWSRSISSADDSNVLDATLAIGYPFKMASDRFRLIPLVGYAYSEQNLKITDGVQTVSEPALAPAGVTPQPLGPFAGLDSTYDTKWYGPWIGVDLLLEASEKIMFFASLEYHWADYEAEAYWNLRANPNFEHEADGTGFLITIGGDYRFAEPWSLGLELNFQDYSTDAGIDRVFISDGTIVETRLNEVNWESFAIMLRLTYRFQFSYYR